MPGTFDAPQRIESSNAGALDHWNAGPLDWNLEYRPWFYRDVWPTLFRVDELKYLNNMLSASNALPDRTERGNFDPTKLSVPPVVSKVLLRERETAAETANQAGTLFLEEIELKLHVFDDVVEQSLRRHGRTAGGCWVIRNLSIYKEPYRLKADPDFYAFSQTVANQNANQIPEQAYLANTDVELSTGNDFTRGLQPGDLTKYSAVPWQADFNECTIQSIDQR